MSGGSRLTIRRERRQGDLVTGVGFLAFGVGLAFFLFRTERLSGDLKSWWMLGLCVAAGLHFLLSRWQVVVDREAGTARRTLGLGVPLLRTEYSLREFDRVDLYGDEEEAREHVLTQPCAVRLGGPGRALVLAGSNDRQEAVALAEAVSRLLGLGLSVDGGRVRAMEERLSAAPLTDTPPEPPPGSRIYVTRHAQGLQVRLPPQGWSLARKGQAVVAGLIAVGVPAFIMGSWVYKLGVRLPQFLTPIGMSLFIAACGAFLLWRLAGEASLGWTITASSKGLEVSRYGRGENSRPERIPRARLQDINLRPLLTQKQRHIHMPPLRPGSPGDRNVEVAIEHDAGVLALGGGLRRVELEWLEETLRRAVATRRDVASQGPRL
ncbi:hypothetical protein HPC49_45605 [Pyxidicoccus fallax]|uniref:Uncharacterized protein n=1 Tax=Pyxidicoccus fallax TaxID=394095 RepID=A0A848LYQ1_9BACT|nr:hypothetical protein [Pyxidicoccus fallax]NMO22966.1 hypothetical protein [Pyxidicoccus fallax]NPC85458.1 hypothetical protein [Pyxidicoccus fallax]